MTQLIIREQFTEDIKIFQINIGFVLKFALGTCKTNVQKYQNL